MRNLKKFLALVMAMVMAFSLMLTVSAANPVKTFDDAGSITEAFQEAADVLTGMKVFQGDEGGFRPGDQINRAEVAALIYRLATGDTGTERKDLYKDYGNFTDVNSSDWFAGYVGYCANAGYIKGKTATTFDPYASVTGYEALAMILRAVGYDKNGEFTGPAWQTNVSALATQLGVLKQVKSTHYGDRLYEASRRDVVASLLFESAQVPTVNYTQIGGYNKFQNLIDNTPNLSLGQSHFGLTSTTRIVVGNQETGESGTLLGIEVGKGYTVPIDASAGAAYDGAATVNEYTYPGSQLAYQKNDGSAVYYLAYDSNGNAINAPAGLKVDLKSGLDLFGHKVKVWYNSTDGKSAHQTYAYFDKATVATTVYSEDANLANDVNGLLAAAKAAGFSKDNGAIWSDQYSRFDTAKVGLAGDASWFSGGNNPLSQVNMYTLVSNSDNKGVDAVIRENIELAEIRKLNTTAVDKAKTLTLGDKPTLGGIDNSDDTVDNKGFTNFTTANREGEILLDNLVGDSVKTLGSIVYATEIRGTNGVNIYLTAGNTPAAPQITNMSPKSAVDNLYKLETPETVESTVSAGTPNTDTEPDTDGNVKTIILGDGTTLKRSGISMGVTPVDGNNDGRVINKAIEVFHYTAGTLNVNYGETYTVYLDKIGRFMGFKQGTDKSFLYGTFADYEIGGLGTGSIKYAVTGVDWDGNIVENHVLTTIVGPVRANDVYGALRTVAANTLAAGYNKVTSVTPGFMDITKKYLGDNTASGSIGNQILPGVYRGFIVNPAGTFWNAATTPAHNNSLIEGLNATGRTFGTWISDTAANNVPAKTASEWTINKTDAGYGFVSVTDGTNQVMLTNNTKFLVVSGTGLDTLKVEKYTGLSEFLGSSSEVTIDFNKTGNYAYYITTADRYNNMNTANNNQVDTVILPAANIIGKNVDTLYYANTDTPTGIRLGSYDQYVLYNDGEAGYYFLNAKPANAKGFYTLEQVASVSGTPVYTAVNVATATGTSYGVGRYDTIKGICREDVLYNYTSTSDLFTGTIDGTNGTADDDKSTLTYRVDNAKVVDLTNNKGTAHDEFKTVADINAAISRGWTDAAGARGLGVSIVNDGVNVSIIYVIEAVPPTAS